MGGSGVMVSPHKGKPRRQVSLNSDGSVVGSVVGSEYGDSMVSGMGLSVSERLKAATGYKESVPRLQLGQLSVGESGASILIDAPEVDDKDSDEDIPPSGVTNLDLYRLQYAEYLLRIEARVQRAEILKFMEGTANLEQYVGFEDSGLTFAFDTTCSLCADTDEALQQQLQSAELSSPMSRGQQPALGLPHHHGSKGRAGSPKYAEKVVVQGERSLLTHPSQVVRSGSNPQLNELYMEPVHVGRRGSKQDGRAIIRQQQHQQQHMARVFSAQDLRAMEAQVFVLLIKFQCFFNGEMPRFTVGMRAQENTVPGWEIKQAHGYPHGATRT